MRWIDDHCHLGWDDAGVEGSDAAVAEARAAGVERIITVGTDAARSAQALAVARRHPNTVWATVGLHPHEARHGLDGVIELLEESGPDDPDDADDPGRAHGPVAIGECGLDYHYDHSPRDVQREVFAAQVGLAHQLDLTLVIHTREAWDDTLAVLDREGTPARTVLHCFTGGPDEVQACLDRGMYVSFSGIVTFRAAQEVRDAAGVCPLDRLLVETDSPYLAPVPHRGRTNRPAYLPLVGAALAEAKQVTPAQVAEASWQNANLVYRLPRGTSPRPRPPC